MSWLVFAALAAASSVLILMLVNTYLYVHYREKCIKIWAVAWGIYLLRYLAMTVSSLWEGNLVTQSTYYLSIIVSAVVLLCGTRQFIGKPPAKRFILAGAILSLWSVAALTREFHPLAVIVPVFGFLAFTYIHLGCQILKQSKEGEFASPVVGWLFILWGIHQVDYPLLRPITWFAPWGFLLGSVLAISIAIGMILIYFERTNRVLLEKEERFRSIMDLSPDIISTLNADGVLTYNSPAAFAIHGFTEEEMVGRNTQELIHPDDLVEVNNAFDALLSDPVGSVTVRYRYRSKDGSYTWMEATASNHLDNPFVRGIVAISRNIEDRVAEEARRLDLERGLLHAQKLESLGILAGGIAHDFNNLLAAILGNLELALLRLPDGSPARKNLEQSVLASRRGADLTRQMLAYAGKGVFQLKEIDLKEIVTANIDLFRTVIPKDITLELDVAGGLPPVLADPGQIQQVVMNLITNAAEAIGTGTGGVRIATGTVYCDETLVQRSVLAEKPAAGRFVFIEVADDGPGMNRETRERLFEPFFTTKFTGRGLGMAATQGIVASHKGMILLESEEGVGTTFRVFFPAVAGRAAVAQEEEERAPEKSAATEGKGKILIVDDEEFIRSVGTSYAQHLGFEALEASNGAEAVEVFRRHSHQLKIVILDLTMPVMDGVAAFHELKKIRPEVPIILTSGYSEQTITTQFAKEKPDSFMQKPFRMNELEAKINQILP